MDRRIRCECEHVSEGVNDCEFGWVASRDAEYGPEGEDLQDIT